MCIMADGGIGSVGMMNSKSARHSPIYTRTVERDIRLLYNRGGLFTVRNKTEKHMKVAKREKD